MSGIGNSLELGYVIKFMNMEATKQMELFQQEQERRRAILIKKANDYSTEEDVLSNFKLTAQVAKTTPEQFAVNMISLKVVRIGNLLGGEGKMSLNESVIDTLDDLENYSFLLKCILYEKSL